MSSLRPQTALGLLAVLAACDIAPEEAERVQIPMATSAAGLGVVQTDAGYAVELRSVRLVVSDFTFFVAGEVHAAADWSEHLASLFIRRASAHPGHYQGGDVTGELLGRFLVETSTGTEAVLGAPTLLLGSYESASFTFGRGSAADGLGAADPLFGHTAVLDGVVSIDAETVPFRVIIDAPEDRLLEGAPFEADLLGALPARLGYRVSALDPLEGDSLFDGVDFAALPRTEGRILIAPDSTDALETAYTVIRRAFMTHDHHAIVPES